MRIWLDDVREAPSGWTRTHSVGETIDLLVANEGMVDELSLDHDLGLVVVAENESGLMIADTRDDPAKEETGYDVLTWLEQRVAVESFASPRRIYCHSDNGPARKRMEAAIASIYRLRAANER